MVVGVPKWLIKKPEDACRNASHVRCKSLPDEVLHDIGTVGHRHTGYYIGPKKAGYFVTQAKREP